MEWNFQEEKNYTILYEKGVKTFILPLVGSKVEKNISLRSMEIFKRRKFLLENFKDQKPDSYQILIIILF
jgi:hypothetical protein